jgi:predicted PurR-regulated permease PerM
MQTESATPQKLPTKDLMDLIIRVGIIAFIVVMCVRIFAPFASLMMWALILAVCLYPLHLGLAKRLGGRHGHAAILLVIAVLLLIGVPTVVLGSSFASHIQDLYSAFSNNAITVAQPDPSVANWPVIGKTVHRVWSSAANDMPALVEELQPQLSELAKYALTMAADTAGSVMLFLVSVIIAGFIMTHGESGSRTMLRIFERLSGPSKGPRLHRLATATVRSVAMGVVGVAFVQALLLGVGFILAGIPAAGILAMVALLFGIAQLPILLVSLPAIGYLWWFGDGSTASNIVFTVYLLVAGFVDSILKPVLLGRGVDAPMPIILLGALGAWCQGVSSACFWARSCLPSVTSSSWTGLRRSTSARIRRSKPRRGPPAGSLWHAPGF